MVKAILINSLTLSRVPLSLMFCAVVLLDASPLLPCAALFILITASDYLDGKLSRRYGVQTGIGAMLDVTADFFFIMAACSSLSLRGLFPCWMLTVILFKFLELWITSAISRGRKNTSVFLFDSLGRIVAALFYLLPILTLLLPHCLPAVALQTTLVIICAGIAGLAALSSTWRIASLIRGEPSFHIPKGRLPCIKR